MRRCLVYSNLQVPERDSFKSNQIMVVIMYQKVEKQRDSTELQQSKLLLGVKLRPLHTNLTKCSFKSIIFSVRQGAVSLITA